MIMTQEDEMLQPEIAARRHMRWKRWFWIYCKGLWLKKWIR